MQKSRRTLAIAAGLAAVGIAASFLLYAGIRRIETAHASPSAELLDEIPAGAPMLVYIDLAAIRASSFYQNRPDRAPIAIPDANYKNFLQATGFDFEKDLDRVVIAAWPQALAKDQKKTVMVAEGRFDRQKIHDYAMKNGKVDHQQGRDVFLFSGRNPGDWNSFAFLDDQRIAMVEGSSIAPLLAPHAADSAADPARERAAHVSGAAAFVITRIPPIPDNFAPGGMQSTELTSLLRSVQWVTLSTRPDGDNLRVSLEGECQTSADARKLQSTLQTMFMFGRMGLESPKTRQSMDPAAFEALDTLLKAADISETAERVRILVEITPDIMKLSGPPKQH
jgi:hypothetical protein